MLADTIDLVDSHKDETLISIRDAARIIGVPPHTIRYWEKEFSDYLVAPRTMGKQRRYGDQQIYKLRTIYRMLKEEGYSIAGAKRALAKQNQAANLGGQANRGPANVALESLSAEMAEKILALVKNELSYQY
jgi:DNA-binding transcriptional MerR regulator